MFSHLLAFETNFDSYSYDSYDFHFDSYFLFHSTNVVYYLSCHPSTKFSSDLIKDQFRESRKYLEPFYTWQPNQLQTNNVTKDMDSFEQSQEPQLPSKDGFYSSVTEEDILKTNL